MSPTPRNAASAWLAAMLMVAAAPPAYAARGQSLTLTGGVSTTYDDNILQYSPDQISLFDSGTRPTHFSIETRDDLVLNPSASLLWELDRGRGRRHALRLKGEGDLHDRNGTADFRSLSASWRESFAHDRRLSLGYFLLPSFYLRQLFDEDVPVVPGLSRYRRASFRLQIATAGWDQRLTKGTEASVDYRFEQRRYHSDFRERDSGLHQGQLGLAWDRLPARARLDLSGGYRVSKAKAEDVDELAGVTPDDPDVSYHGFVAAAGGRVELGRRAAWRLQGDLGLELETRDYTSDRPADKSHFGRNDRLVAVEIGARALCRPHVSVRGFYRHEANDARFGATGGPVTDPGSYRVNQAGIAVEWSGEVWRQARLAPASEGGGEN